jgi:uncharacterized protein (DUF2249 family)
MKPINAHSKIADILREHPAALETIVGLSPRFERLRNPLLRKLLAGRTTLAMASRMGGCTVNDFFDKLRPLGFVFDEGSSQCAQACASVTDNSVVPAFMWNLAPGQVVELDVRPILREGADPLGPIMEKLKTLGPDSVLRIIAPFKPEPLIRLLGKKGFESWSETIGDESVHTWFRMRGNDHEMTLFEKPYAVEDWGAMVDRYKGRLVAIDVRHLEMPLPMMAILETLDGLPDGDALLVHHKRIPVFLLPELAERGWTWRINEIGPSEVELIIFKDTTS